MIIENKIDMFGFYDNLKPKVQYELMERDYINIIINLLLPMVNFIGFPNSVSTKNLNLYRMMNGAFGVTELNGELVSLCADGSDVLDVNGDFTKVIMHSYFNNTVIDRTNGVDCVVGYNNSMHLPDYNIQRFAYMFSQTDLSMMYNLKYARMNKIFKASTDATKNALEKALKGADKGETNVIVSDNIFNDVFMKNKGMDEIASFDITDVEQIDKLQYLSNFHQDLLKRLCWLYGVPMNQQSKMAQVSEFEVSNSNNGSQILLFDIMKNANDFCDKVNKLYGLNTRAELGDAWKVALIGQGIKTDEDGIIENVNVEIESEEGGKDAEEEV